MAYMMNRVLGFSRICAGKMALPAKCGGQLQKPVVLRRSIADQGVKDVIKPSEADKRLLVKSNIYKTIEEIPETIGHSQMRRARDWNRIYWNFSMVCLTVVVCAGIIVYGRSRQYTGDSLHERSMKWREGSTAKDS